MTEKEKQNVLEQYDDLTFKLLMDEYAEEEGARLLAEFEQAAEAGTNPEVPQSLDDKCHKMIRKKFAQERWRIIIKESTKKIGRVAAVLLLFVGIVMTPIFSVEAFRVPLLNYLLEHHEKYSSIVPSEHISKSHPHADITYIDAVMPETYSQTHCEYEGNGSFVCVYADQNNDVIRYNHYPVCVDFQFDTEKTTYSEMQILNHDAFLVHKDGLQIIWIDKNNQLIHSIYASDYAQDSVIALAEKIALGME